MAEAMKLAIEAGRLAYLSGRMTKRLYASASSPVTGVVRKIDVTFKARLLLLEHYRLPAHLCSRFSSRTSPASDLDSVYL